MRKKMFGSICLVLAIIILVTTGTTFAYFYASANSNGDSISGKTADFDIDLNLTTVHKATDLVPLSDDLIDEAITKTSNKCIDKNGYQVCSLFTLTLVNNGDPQVLNGYIKTASSTYTTNNLKYQIFDSSYKPVTKVMTLSKTANEKVYFMNNTNKISTEINNSNVVYHLAIWLTETNDFQNEDYDKIFNGVIGFEALAGEKIEATFGA